MLVLAFEGVYAYDFGDGSIDVPEGFEGPVEKSMGQGATTTAFTYPHGNGGGALLQITAWDPGQDFPQMSDDQLRAGSKQYLLQLIAGVERKRNEFKQQKVEFIQISGHPAAKVTWSGELQGKDVHGVMYCLIFNSKIYSFHTQDFSSFNERYSALAVNAIEAVELEK